MILQHPQTLSQNISPTPESPQPQTPELQNLQPPLPPEAVAEATEVIQNTAAFASETPLTASPTTTATAAVTSPPIDDGDGNGTNGNNIDPVGDDIR